MIPSKISQNVFLGDFSLISQDIGNGWFGAAGRVMNLVVFTSPVSKTVSLLKESGYFSHQTNTCFLCLDPDFDVNRLSPDDIDLLSSFESHNAKPLDELLNVAKQRHNPRFSVPVITRDWKSSISTTSLFIQSLSQAGKNVYIIADCSLHNMATILALSYTIFATGAQLRDAVQHMGSVSRQLGQLSEEIIRDYGSYSLLSQLRQQAIGMRHAESVSSQKRELETTQLSSLDLSDSRLKRKRDLD
ncbi:unnamed protein product [Kuraishia capsulata CBS 1993]|uniref:Uncharacterized protein n=1 Tax=Kuraishia capsulata CBS 1993 TaxID=1382522 RepID=W6MXX3_9ASCO|nr:uncharacterized protein KUCA_T00005628001 [Kuraishia capsulata CBS 1993]CDK29635.1 unnamed protein product [Kuraishia capsulata CBS 1993]